ncbi:MAG: CoA synthetase [Proteobacteria bacterium]|nr:CoA synthetase [Pseudomonadota bacterium]
MNTEIPVEQTQSCSVQEIMAVFLARDLVDGEQLQVGVGLPVPEAAVRLAHLMHGPNMELIFLGARMNVAHLDSIPLPQFGWDRRVVRWAESYSDTGHRFDHVNDWAKRVFFVGGIQVDPQGNTNLIGIGEDHRRLKFRGPGSVGTPTLTTHVGRYYIVLNTHTARTFVPKCDFISTVGWGDGDPNARSKLGLPGGGPRYCVTPLCVMDFTESPKRLRLRSVHPGVCVDEVRDHTGFDLVIPDEVPITALPTPAELTVLRERVDPGGLLRSPN